MSDTISTDLSNYYGVVYIYEENGKYFWGLEDWNSDSEQQIPKSLYDEILKFVKPPPDSHDLPI